MIPNSDDINRYESGLMDREEIVFFFQGLIDSGFIWELQGSYGRTAYNLISAGDCQPARTWSTNGAS